MLLNRLTIKTNMQDFIYDRRSDSPGITFYVDDIEADSIEEAVEMVKNNEVDPKDSDILFNLEDQEPLEVEIMDENENVLYRK